VHGQDHLKTGLAVAKAYADGVVIERVYLPSGTIRLLLVACSHLKDLDPMAVRVELYADKIGDDAPVQQEMQRMRQLVGATNGYAYRALVTDARPLTDYTVRVVPYHEAAAIPLENNHILWQR